MRRPRAGRVCKEDDLRKSFSLGAENGGVDFARRVRRSIAHWGISLRDAAPRTVLPSGQK